jgi:hypothetical protein
MNLKGDVKSGKITAEQALEKLSKIPNGEKTITYRRLKRGSIHPMKVEKPKEKEVEVEKKKKK